VTTLGYTGNRLTSVTLTDPGEQTWQSPPTWTFEYYNDGLMKRMVNPNNADVDYDYSVALFQRETYPNQASRELVPTASYGLGDTNLIGYDAQHLAPARRPNQVQATRTDPRNGQWQRHVETDRFGYVISQTDALGNTTTYERDKNGQVTRMTEPDPDGGGPLGVTVTTYEYDSQGRRTRATYAVGTAEAVAIESLLASSGI